MNNASNLPKTTSALLNMAPVFKARREQSSLLAPLTQKPPMAVLMRDLVDNIRTTFEQRNDITIYIPSFYS